MGGAEELGGRTRVSQGGKGPMGMRGAVKIIGRGKDPSWEKGGGGSYPTAPPTGCTEARRAGHREGEPQGERGQWMGGPGENPEGPYGGGGGGGAETRGEGGDRGAEGRRGDTRDGRGGATRHWEVGSP